MSGWQGISNPQVTHLKLTINYTIQLIYNALNYDIILFMINLFFQYFLSHHYLGELIKDERWLKIVKHLVNGDQS